MTDPRRRHRAIVGALWLSAIAIVLSVYVLARPTPSPGVTSNGTPATPEPTAPDAPHAALDPTSFDVTLWTAPTPRTNATSTRVAQRPPPPPPLRLQLIAILTDSAAEPPTYRAALYDPDADELSVVGAGEQFGRITVSAITDRTVHLAVGDRQQQLSLDDDARAGGRR